MTRNEGARPSGVHREQAEAQERARRWRDENETAMKEVNDWVEAHGLPLSRHNDIRSLRGKLQWHGDLEAMRRD